MARCRDARRRARERVSAPFECAPRLKLTNRSVACESVGMNAPVHVVCLASFFKGNAFLQEAKRLGCRVTLVTKESLRDDEWAREAIDELVCLPDDGHEAAYLQAVANVGRMNKIDRLVALEEYDVLAAARIREHLHLWGTSHSTLLRFRDKLTMRAWARAAGVRVPEFVHLLNYNEVGQFMERVVPPYTLKPRTDVSAIGIRKLDETEKVWRAIDELNAHENFADHATNHLLERFVPGAVFHVDSLVEDGKVVFAGVSAYGRPPMEVAHGGGVFISQIIKRNSTDERALLKLNRQLIKSCDLRRGATHAEFIKDGNGDFYFLEIAARVGGAYIAETLEAASGINLWRAWAQIELNDEAQRLDLTRARRNYAGIVLSLAHQEYPDTSSYTEDEIVYRVKKRFHVGLVVRAGTPERVTELLNEYATRFQTDFCAVAPPLTRPQ